MNKIVIITTGGTIEKTYDEHDGSLTNQGSVLKAMLARLRLPHTVIQQVNLIAKDSLYMEDQDRQLILDEINRYMKDAAAVIVLHGTDTMEHSARYVYEKLGTPPVPVVFTGAMKPYGFEDSDALQNLTEALALGPVIAPGTYIVFHGQVLPLPHVRKNRETLTFERTETSLN